VWRFHGFAACALLMACSDGYDGALLRGGRDGGGRPDVDAGGGSAFGPDAAPPPESCDEAANLTACALAHADAVCLDGICNVVRCRSGFVDCDGEDANGCEATLDSTEHCGACGAACDLPHVDAQSCASDGETPRCVITRDCSGADTDCTEPPPESGCDPGFGDCDGSSDNGCEMPLDTLTDCGGCGQSCAIDEAQATCESGGCMFVGCAPGFGDCGGEGCQRLLEDPDHCGACGSRCPPGRRFCAGGRCTAEECASGNADCDGERGNGCEADLATASTCAGCDLSCGPYPNAEAACAEERCAIVGCDPGWGDCDGQVDNGCEADVALALQNCGVCGRDCGALAHVVSASCAAGECAQLECEPGWGDCDGDADNGCEQSLNTLEHCNSCGRACAPARATATCDTGTCMITACDEGFDECNGELDDGCEADLGGTAHCGGCGNACPAGVACNDGGCGCANDDDCPSGLTCCDGSCIGTRGSCVWWPCPPGSTRDRDNCGGCGRVCDRLACCG